MKIGGMSRCVTAATIACTADGQPTGNHDRDGLYTEPEPATLSLQQEGPGAFDGDVAADLADRKLLADPHQGGGVDEAGFH